MKETAPRMHTKAMSQLPTITLPQPSGKTNMCLTTTPKGFIMLEVAVFFISPCVFAGAPMVAIPSVDMVIVAFYTRGFSVLKMSR